MWHRIFILLGIGLDLTFCTTAGAQQSILEQVLQAEPAIVEIKAQGVGLIKGPTQQTGIAAFERDGAGVIIHAAGIIATNAHTVSQAQAISVRLHDQTIVSAQIIRYDPSSDLCLLKITPPYPLTAIPLADSNNVHLGDEIFTIGNSSISKEAITGGKVTGLGTNHSLLVQGQRRNDLIRTTINLYQGDSGGPLFDHNANLIGLMTAKEVSAEHSSFAIPSNRIAQDLIDYLKEVKEKYEQTHANP